MIGIEFLKDVRYKDYVMRLFRKVFHRQKGPRLLAHHFDEPPGVSEIAQSSFAIRGWVTFDAQFPAEEVSFCLVGSGKRWEIGCESRPDVVQARPNEFAVGFNSLVDYLDVFPSAHPLILEVSYPGGQTKIDTHLTATKSAQYAEGYFSEGGRKCFYPKHLDADLSESWKQNGYLWVPKFYSEERIDAINTYIDELWADRNNIDPRITIDTWLDTPKQLRASFQEVADQVRSYPYKINDLYLADPYIREVILNPEIAKILRDLLEGDPTICGSLYFEYGSQQPAHYDTFYMAPLVRNRMLASWIALENVDASAGPLFYYPGSHLIEPYRFKDGRFALNPQEADDCFEYIDKTIDRAGIDPVSLHAEKGDLFIWHAQLLHGGTAIRDPKKTRRSLVTHYFRHGDPMGGKPDREFDKGRFFLDRDFLPVDIYP